MKKRIPILPIIISLLLLVLTAAFAAAARRSVSGPGTTMELSQYSCQSLRPSSLRAPTVKPNVMPYG